MDFKRGISHFKEAKIATSTARQSSNLTTGRKDLPEIYILVLVSCLYSCFIRVGGSFISASGIVADFFVCLWQPRTHFVAIGQLYFHVKLISVTVSIVILFSRANYNNRLLLNNFTRWLESADVDEKKQWIERQRWTQFDMFDSGSFELANVDSWVFCPCQTF